MSPSNPVSIGILLESSIRTLEVGSAHVRDVTLPEVLLLTLAQFQVTEDPFTEVDVCTQQDRLQKIQCYYSRHHNPQFI